MRKDIQVFRGNGVSLTGKTDFVSGTRKLAQRVIMELLTEQGSMQYLPERGCSFLQRIRQGISEFDVTVAFAAARSRIRRLMKGETTPDTPPQERFVNMRLDAIVLGESSLMLTITIFSRAGALQVDTPPIPLE